MSRNGPKVRCTCGSLYSRVLPDGKTGGHAIEQGEAIYRRLRKCLKCGGVFTALETFEAMVQEGQKSA